MYGYEVVMAVAAWDDWSVLGWQRVAAGVVGVAAALVVSVAWACREIGRVRRRIAGLEWELSAFRDATLTTLRRLDRPAVVTPVGSVEAAVTGVGEADYIRFADLPPGVSGFVGASYFRVVSPDPLAVRLHGTRLQTVSRVRRSSLQVEIRREAGDVRVVAWPAGVTCPESDNPPDVGPYSAAQVLNPEAVGVRGRAAPVTDDEVPIGRPDVAADDQITTELPASRESVSSPAVTPPAVTVRAGADLPRVEWVLAIREGGAGLVPARLVSSQCRGGYWLNALAFTWRPDDRPVVVRRTGVRTYVVEWPGGVVPRETTDPPTNAVPACLVAAPPVGDGAGETYDGWVAGARFFRIGRSGVRLAKSNRRLFASPADVIDGVRVRRRGYGWEVLEWPAGLVIRDVRAVSHAGDGEVVTNPEACTAAGYPPVVSDLPTAT